jgi:glycosyltransferase involved in cell wall biosynthesis
MRIRVLIVVAGGLRDPGGVTRCMENLIESWRGLPDHPSYRVVDPRGAGSILWSPLHFLSALVIICWEVLVGRAVVVHANMCEYGSTLRKLPIVCLTRALGAHAVIHLHGAEMKKMFDTLPTWLRHGFRLGILRADRIVTLGKSWEEFLCRDVGVDREKVVTIYNAVPIPNLTRQAEPDRCRLLFLGRLEERKGADRFLHALHSPEVEGLDWTAVMAGDGQIDRYHELAKDLNLMGRVRFTGWLDRNAVTALMRASDILVLPSLNEGLPMAILESMAHGLAVVATPVGAIPDVIHDEETGLLVPPGDSHALASALHRIITDRELRLRLGRNARKLAEAEFDVARYGDRFLRLYGEVLRT